MTNREVFYQELCTVGSFLEHVFRHGNVGQRGSREDYLDRKPETTYICARESEASGIDVSKEKRRGIIVAFNGPPYYTWVNHS